MMPSSSQQKVLNSLWYPGICHVYSADIQQRMPSKRADKDRPWALTILADVMNTGLGFNWGYTMGSGYTRVPFWSSGQTWGSN
eukprot:3744923-Pyramimonas_sp.AAC.1